MGIERIDGCIGCGTCVSTCPMDVLRMAVNGKKVEIRYPQDYQACRLCQMYCPVEAITIASGRSVPAMTAWG